jgi:hypothetical protein
MPNHDESRFRAAPTQHEPLARVDVDIVTRRARLRIDIVSDDYPREGRKPDYAYVQLLDRPRAGQPVVWTSSGTNALTLYDPKMRDGGVAFVVTGLGYANA